MRLNVFIRLGWILIIFGVLSGCAALNNYQTKGDLNLAGLKEPVMVIRDEKGMAYIHAGSLDDALIAQGFVMAQDRLFQMEMIRRAAQGRISEVLGGKAKAFDIRMRTFGFHRKARKHAQILDVESYQYLENFIRGVNVYINTRPKTRPLELKLAGIQPSPWTVADVLSIVYYMSWGTSANRDTEVVAQMLLEKVGFERIGEILPVNINPDDTHEGPAHNSRAPIPKNRYAAAFKHRSSELFNRPYPINIGSNNWVAGGGLTVHGKPILANDPHLEANMLPGPWYPCGLITPSVKAVGAIIPGIPGLLVFRNDHITLGITNAYGDTQDLYIETLDPKNPNRYMESEKSLPFNIIEETLIIKDKRRQMDTGRKL